MLVRVDLCQMENLGFCLTAEFLSSRQMEQFIQKITAFPIPAVPEQGMAESDIPTVVIRVLWSWRWIL